MGWRGRDGEKGALLARLEGWVGGKVLLVRRIVIRGLSGLSNYLDPCCARAYEITGKGDKEGKKIE